MTKYIDANSFLEYEENRCKNSPPLIGTCSFDNVTLREELANFLEADVETVRHGHWITDATEFYQLWNEKRFLLEKQPYLSIDCVACSECLRIINRIDNCMEDALYCQHCGAKMDEGAKC